MNIWLTIGGMALATFATRFTPLLSMRGAPDPRVERVLRYVPPAIFAALIVPGLLMPRGQLTIGIEFWAGIVGALVAYWTRNVALTIVAGLLVFAILRWIGF
jgi:branched-subunit amino acid transport protein